MTCELCRDKRKVRVWTTTDSGLIEERVQDCPRCSGGPNPFKDTPGPITPPMNMGCQTIPVIRGRESEQVSKEGGESVRR